MSEREEARAAVAPVAEKPMMDGSFSVRIDPALAPDEFRIEWSAHDILRIIGIGMPRPGDKKMEDRYSCFECAKLTHCPSPTKGMPADGSTPPCFEFKHAAEKGEVER